MDPLSWLLTLALMPVGAWSLYRTLSGYKALIESYISDARDGNEEARLKASSAFGWFVLSWQAWLVVLLREPHPTFALAWAVVLVVTACEVVFVLRVLRRCLLGPGDPAAMALLVSWPVRAWRVVAELMGLVGCGLALLLSG
ncbi:MAG: hypothetical protein VKS61_07125 [Candidatus Sericytochromatia bacterium]|nr:hypothetical protein [Candidatus Sericytochromatia bacterium]